VPVGLEFFGLADFLEDILGLPVGLTTSKVRLHASCIASILGLSVDLTTPDSIKRNRKKYVMGEPVKIKNLAEDLFKLSGFTPHEDIDIIYTGLRPGEKLFEELLTAEEGIIPSP